MAVTASVDEAGYVWASLLTGPPGFLKAMNDEVLHIAARLASEDLLARNLAAKPDLGVLVIDLAKRRRLRVNGRALLDGDKILLSVEQAYAQCPKHIRPRRVEPVQGARSERKSSELDVDQLVWIADADLFFVASHHPNGGADASYRGGPPGFVRLLGPRSLSFSDYPGESMLSTLGNVQGQPRVGLLFLDLDAGSTLQLTGRASLSWDPAAAADPDRPRAVVSFELDLAFESHGCGVRGALVEDATAER